MKRIKDVQYQDWIAKCFPDEVVADETGENNMARTFTFQVTDKCNLACTYCYQINKGVRRLSVDTAKKIVDDILSGAHGFEQYLDGCKAIILEFIGGEPFLEIDLIDEICDYFLEQAILLNHRFAKYHMISICSNGVLYRDEKVQRFLLKHAGYLSFSVTVDGTEELHDSCRVFPDGRPSYDLAHDAAMDWMHKGYRMGSKITIAPANVQYLDICLRKMLEDGYTDINANTVFEKGWEKKHALEMYNQIKSFSDWADDHYDKKSFDLSLLQDDPPIGVPMRKSEDRNWCGTTGYMMSVDPDGRYFTCIRFMESSLGDDIEAYSVGSVETGIGSCDCERCRIDCLNKITRRSQSEDRCFYCPIASGCAWCTAYNYQENGTPDKRVDYSCDMHKARSLGTVYYWNNYYKKNNINEVKPLFIPKAWALEIISEDEYNDLVELTKSLGGYVNDDITQVVLNEDATAVDEDSCTIIARG